MKPRLLVLRSGERPFPSELVPGLEVVERVTHTIETLRPDASSIAGRFDLVIVTSRAAADRLSQREDLLSRLSGRLVAVGPATAERLRSALLVEVEEGGGAARQIIAKLPSDLSGARVLLPRGDDSSEELPRELAARGADVVALNLYRKVARPYDRALDAIVMARDLAAFCPTSPAAARWLFGGAPEDALSVLRETPAIALGASTGETLSDFGVVRVEIAQPPTFETVAQVAVGLAAHASRE